MCVCRFPCYIMNNNTDFVVTRHDVALIEVFIADNWMNVAVSVSSNNLPVLSGAAVHDAGGAPGSVVRLLLLRGLHLMLHQN